MSKVPKGLISRSVELLKLAAKVGSEEVFSDSTNPIAKQLEQAKSLVDSLGRLKGAAMKVGQLLSMDFSDLFPPEVRNVLEQLQSSSPHFMSQKEVMEILLKEIPTSDLQDLSPEPIAAASIGQVHSAKWKGHEIVLKIQYPGVADSIDSDVALLKGVVQSLLAITRKKMDLDPLFNELKEVFKKETNYILEKENLEKYKSFLKGNEAYVCPEVFPELCTEKVLTMSYEKGTPLRKWLHEPHSLASREKIGKNILNLYSIEFFDNAFVQSDPNPANFIVSDDEKLILLDFGAIKKFERKFVEEYTSLMSFVHKKDQPGTIYQAIQMGFMNPKESDNTKELFFKMLRSSLCAFDEDRQPFDFTDKTYFELTKAGSRDFGKLSEFSPPPFEIVFLHRKLVGIFGMLRDLGLKLDLTPYWKKVTQTT